MPSFPTSPGTGKTLAEPPRGSLESVPVDQSKWASVGVRFHSTAELRAAAANINLSESAKDAVVTAALRRATFEGISPDDQAQTEQELAAVVSALSSIKSNWSTFTDVETSLANLTAAKVINGLPTDLARKAKDLGLVFTPAVEERVISDLKVQTIGLARSGASESYIRNANDNLIFAFYSADSSRPIDQQAYKRVRLAFFTPVVRLTIYSEPSGAEVEISGRRAGKTTIEREPLDPGREYVLTFRLARYKPARRVIYVVPGEPEQTVREVLLPEEETSGR